MGVFARMLLHLIVMYVVCLFDKANGNGQQSYTDHIDVKMHLGPGDKLISSNGDYELRMQRDGNLVIYKLNWAPHGQDQPVWATGWNDVYDSLEC